MNVGQAGATSWWHHREARKVTGTAGPPAAERAAGAQDAEASWEPHHASMPASAGGLDLVDVQHLHVPVAMDRAAVLARAAAAVSPGGMLLVAGCWSTSAPTGPWAAARDR